MNYCIIGGSAAGISAVEGIRSRDPKGKITIISDESFPLYSRCLLTYWLAGSITIDHLKFKDTDFYSKNRVETIFGQRAERINQKKKELVLSDGRTVGYDKLLLATGARPKRLGIPGEDKKGVLGIRTLTDAKEILGRLNEIDTVCILGGGLIGLRDAYALRQRGKKVNVIVKSGQILSQMLDEQAAGLIEELLVKNGIAIKKGLDAEQVLGDKTVTGIGLDDGTELACQLVIEGKGVVPNIELLEGTDIQKDWGILVDEGLRTNDPGIYAAGDIAQAYDIAKGMKNVNAIWPVACEQGRIAGRNMAGAKQAYEGSLGMNSIEFFDLPAISMGVTRPREDGYEVLAHFNKAHAVYKKVVIKNNRLAGAVLVGRVEQAGIYTLLIRKQADISAVKDILLSEHFDFGKIIPLIKQNPDKFREEEFLHATVTY